MANLVTFTLEEESKVLKYIIDHDKFNSLQDTTFWKEVEKADFTKRTWQNLKDHFENKLIHKLKHPYYKLPESIIKKFQGAFTDTKNKMLTNYTGNSNAKVGEKKPNAKRNEIQINVKGNDKTIYVFGKFDEDKPLKAGKRILITRTNANERSDVYKSYTPTSNRRILVTRVENPSSHFLSPKSSTSSKTVPGSLSTGKKREIFIVKGKNDEKLGRYDQTTDKDKTKDKSKKLICLSYDKE